MPFDPFGSKRRARARAARGRAQRAEAKKRESILKKNEEIKSELTRRAKASEVKNVPGLRTPSILTEAASSVTQPTDIESIPTGNTTNISAVNTPLNSTSVSALGGGADSEAASRQRGASQLRVGVLGNARKKRDSLLAAARSLSDQNKRRETSTLR